MKKIILTTAILASLALNFGGATTAQADTLTDIANTTDVQKTLQEQTDKADISGITGADNTEEQANNIVDAFDTNTIDAQGDWFFGIATKITGNLSEAIKYQKESTENLIIKSINTITVLVNGNADEQLEKEAIIKDMASIQKFIYGFDVFENENIKIANVLKNGAISVICLTALALLVKAIPLINNMFFGTGEFSKAQIHSFKQAQKRNKR